LEKFALKKVWIGKKEYAAYQELCKVGVAELEMC
jgi:hypothetical protein